MSEFTKQIMTLDEAIETIRGPALSEIGQIHHQFVLDNGSRYGPLLMKGVGIVEIRLRYMNRSFCKRSKSCRQPRATMKLAEE